MTYYKFQNFKSNFKENYKIRNLIIKIINVQIISLQGPVAQLVRAVHS